MNKFLVVYEIRQSDEKHFHRCPVIVSAEASYASYKKAASLLQSYGWKLGFPISCEEIQPLWSQKP